MCSQISPRTRSLGMCSQISCLVSSTARVLCCSLWVLNVLTFVSHMCRRPHALCAVADRLSNGGYPYPILAAC